MSTLTENVQKVVDAHAALKTSIEAKGVTVPAGTKLTGMPALVDQIQTGGGGGGEPTNTRAVFTGDTSSSIVVPNTMVVDMMAITNLNSCFKYCSFLKSLTMPDGFGQNATDIQDCFYYCYSLPSLVLPEGFGQNAQYISNCFNGCDRLTSLVLPNGFGQNAADISNCFNGCSGLPSLVLPEGFGQNATDISYCFYRCQSLTSLTLPEGFGQNAENISYCFDSCQSLVDITGNPKFKVSLDLSQCESLTHDSLMVVINGLQTVTETQTLTLGSTNLDKLTEEEKQVAIDKGWTLA